MEAESVVRFLVMGFVALNLRKLCCDVMLTQSEIECGLNEAVSAGRSRFGRSVRPSWLCPPARSAPLSVMRIPPNLGDVEDNFRGRRTTSLF